MEKLGRCASLSLFCILNVNLRLIPSPQARSRSLTHWTAINVCMHPDLPAHAAAAPPSSVSCFTLSHRTLPLSTMGRLSTAWYSVARNIEEISLRPDLWICSAAGYQAPLKGDSIMRTFRFFFDISEKISGHGKRPTGPRTRLSEPLCLHCYAPGASA